MKKTEMMDELYMKRAIEIATRGIQKGQTPFGACIVQKNTIIAASHNKVWKNKDITAHAEVETIRLACKKTNKIHLKSATIYSTCEPCPMCFSAIHWAGISRIVYGADIADAEKAGFREMKISNKRLISLSKSEIVVTKHVLRASCVELFSLWERGARSKTY